jgi:hypothetical protein
MTPAEYRVFLDGEAAGQEDLDRFETVTVEQEADRPWEARLEVPVCLDEQGNWSGDDERFMQAFRRIRVELKVGEGDFVALIDGPVVGYDSGRRSSPGQSAVTLVVHDDGALLHRRAADDAFPPGSSDADIARRIFGGYGEIAATEVEDTPAPPDALPPEHVPTGTHMQVLRALARRNDFHAAVLPGDSPGASIGVFHSSPVFTDALPELVLFGAERNIDTFDVRFNAQGPVNLVASTLSFSDKSVVTRKSRVRDLTLVGEVPPLAGDEDVGTERLRPGAGEGVELQHRVDREARRRSRAFTATGSVRLGCYAGVLRPFRRVTVKLGTTPTSGSYLVERVVHRLTRSDYAQEFTLVTDAVSETAAGSGLIPAGLF